MSCWYWQEAATGSQGGYGHNSLRFRDSTSIPNDDGVLVIHGSSSQST